jgi:hypothetical protein
MPARRRVLRSSPLPAEAPRLQLECVHQRPLAKRGWPPMHGATGLIGLSCALERAGRPEVGLNLGGSLGGGGGGGGGGAKGGPRTAVGRANLVEPLGGGGARRDSLLGQREHHLEGVLDGRAGRLHHGRQGQA